MANSKKDHLEIFHDYGLHIPSRTIELGTTLNEEGEADGVNHAMAMKFLRNFMYLESLNKEPINIIMNTGGGNVAEGFVIYDAIKTSKCTVTIKVVGQACSMGCVVLQAADHRILNPNATVMFHAGFGGVGEYNPYEVANSAEYDKRFMERMYSILLERINQKRQKDGKADMAKKTFELMNLKGRYMFAEEAVEEGLADAIAETYESAE